MDAVARDGDEPCTWWWGGEVLTSSGAASRKMRCEEQPETGLGSQVVSQWVKRMNSAHGAVEWREGSVEHCQLIRGCRQKETILRTANKGLDGSRKWVVLQIPSSSKVAHEHVASL